MEGMKFKKLKFGGFFLAGMIAGCLLIAIVFNKQVKFRFNVQNLPYIIEIDPCGPPHQIPISFGMSPSDWPFGKALKIVADRTAGAGPARIMVDSDLYSHRLSRENVRPPSGNQPSLELVKQLIASANATDEVQICLVPAGGYRVCLR